MIETGSCHLEITACTLVTVEMKCGGSCTDPRQRMKKMTNFRILYIDAHCIHMSRVADAETGTRIKRWLLGFCGISAGAVTLKRREAARA
jgi:hypothetical protein